VQIIPASPDQHRDRSGQLNPLLPPVKKASLLLLCLALITPLWASDPAKVALAQQVIKATQFDKVFDQMGAQMQQMAAQAMNLSDPNMTAAQKDAAMKVMGEITTLSMNSAKTLMEDVDLIYADVYSDAELNAMLAFFESAEGKSMQQKQPLVMQHLMPLVQNMQKELMPKIKAIVDKAKADAAAAKAAAAVTAPAAPQGATVSVTPN
jgi:uncharacterized protein